MASIISQVAQCVVDQIEDGQPYVIDPLDIELRWTPYFDRVTLGEATKIVISPTNQAQSTASRSLRTHDLTIDTFIQKAINHESFDEGDEVAELGEAVNDQIRLIDLFEVCGYCVNLANVTFEPFVFLENLLEYRIFTSRITSLFRLWKQ